ncbi:alanine--tRNA ligase [Alkanindiges illinoisensis]|uniref:Alanine--tRNA ligase n=1 Tax=Alkanindiges illinoisensis TaxID=197183 RepID=A0A4Y7XGA1_9GAMM|nr:alanine--tRNA ligase [Alkanindiges illinoisensis]TEU30553.1 alanine--tRNA ligase [Alkanindiges illinoisensis]
MTSNEIREAFLRYFETQGHTRVASSSLIPANDPTLLFTNAGMNQFKDCFLGLDKRHYVRATSSQKCVRAGGKHNDLDNVGYTARHHTFFEMLGNFSFGDYFKQDAIRFAWEFLTSAEWLALPTDRLYVTVYATDDEAFDIWNKDIGLSADRIIRIGDNKGAPYASDNFWAMGDTGPCGPCTEIFYDHGADIAGGLPGTPEEDGDRFIEIWNNVFMQFNRTADGVLHPLPAPSVDTGMGLERISAVMQHVHSNYEIDLFQHLIKSAAQIIGIENQNQPSLRVLADHARSCSFLIADGVIPSNEGRGYVLRRIIRRAVRHGNKLGATGSFFHKMVQPLIDVMGEAYPELVNRREVVEATLLKEEEQFARTLEQGLRLLETELAQLQGNTIAGSMVFKLYDTYGFPVDLTADIARERNLQIDEAGFEAEMAQQRQRARDAGKFNIDYNSIVKVDQESVFHGYAGTDAQGNIIALYKDGQAVDSLSEGDEGLIVLDQTPFYAESGGQVGDTGLLTGENGIFEVQDTKKSGSAIVHQGLVTMGSVSVSQAVQATVKADMRAATARNHSATHLLHAALRQVLGTHVSQKGSLVSASVLRFDFANDQPVSFAQLQEIERLVNAEVIANTPVSTEELDIESAKNKGAMMLFGEKYGDKVRVLSMGSQKDDRHFSIELCGGIHVNRTGDIGLFKIISEGGIAAGIRRIEAVTGTAALAVVQQADQQLAQISSLIKAQRDQVFSRVEAMAENSRLLEKQIERLNQKLASSQSAELVEQAQEIAGIKTLIAELDNMDGKTLRNLLDSVKSRLSDGVIVLAATDGAGKVSLLASVAKEYTAKVKAGDIIKHLTEQLGGKGGGKPDLAQGGAPIAPNYADVMGSLPDWLATQYTR